MSQNELKEKRIAKFQEIIEKASNDFEGQIHCEHFTERVLNELDCYDCSEDGRCLMNCSGVPIHLKGATTPTPEAKELLERIIRAINERDGLSDDYRYFPQWIEDLLYDCGIFIEQSAKKGNEPCNLPHLEADYPIEYPIETDKPSDCKSQDVVEIIARLTGGAFFDEHAKGWEEDHALQMQKEHRTLAKQIITAYEQATGAGGEEWKTIDSAPKDGT